MNYFDQTDYISNSDLSSLKDALRLEEDKDLTHIYNFGSLFHGLITEPHKIDHDNKELIEGDRRIRFSEEKFENAKAMYEAAVEDPVIKKLLESSKREHEVYRKRFRVEYQGMEIFIPTRCKFDFLKEEVKLGADLKGLSITSESSLLETLQFFDYDRQAAWYMDHKNLDHFMIIAISKKKVKGRHIKSKFVIERGDEVYEKGKRKYSYLAFLYYHFIYTLNLL